MSQRKQNTFCCRGNTCPVSRLSEIGPFNLYWCPDCDRAAVNTNPKKYWYWELMYRDEIAGIQASDSGKFFYIVCSIQRCTKQRLLTFSMEDDNRFRQFCHWYTGGTTMTQLDEHHWNRAKWEEMNPEKKEYERALQCRLPRSHVWIHTSPQLRNAGTYWISLTGPRAYSYQQKHTHHFSCDCKECANLPAESNYGIWGSVEPNYVLPSQLKNAQNAYWIRQSVYKIDLCWFNKGYTPEAIQQLLVSSLKERMNQNLIDVIMTYAGKPNGPIGWFTKQQIHLETDPSEHGLIPQADWIAVEYDSKHVWSLTV